MRFLDKDEKSQLAFLTAKALKLSYKEQVLPQFFPFFRLGLSNAIILKSLDLPYSMFFVLCALKSLATSTINGTLFTPFFALSLIQSVLCGSLMYAVNRLKINSVFGLSVLGASFSAVVQLFFCSLYINQNLIVFLGPMLFFSLFSSFLTANLALKLDYNFCANDSTDTKDKTSIEEPQIKKLKLILLIFSMVLFLFAIFFIKNLIALTVFFVLCLCLQVFAKKKIRVVPHLALWAFVIFVPFLLDHTSQELLQENLRRALRLSSSMALSQACTKINFPQDSLIALTLKNFNKEE